MGVRLVVIVNYKAPKKLCPSPVFKANLTVFGAIVPLLFFRANENSYCLVQFLH